MKNKIKIIGLISLITLMVGCGKVPKLKNGEEVVTNLKGKNITTTELYTVLKEKYGIESLIEMVDDYILSIEIKDDKVAKENAEAQLNQIKKQYEQYASYGYDLEADLKNAGFEDEDAYIDFLVKQYNKEKLAKTYIKENMIEDSEIDDYYEDEIFGNITARHILIAPEVTDDMSENEKAKAEEDAYNKAEDLIKELKNGAKFEDLAKEYSDDEGTKEDGGLFADFSKDEVVEEFWDAAYDLKDGEYTTKPVKSTYGYHIILKVSADKKPALKDVKDDIIDTITETKLSSDSNLFNEVWNKIRESHGMKINDDDLKSSYEDMYE